MKYILFSTIILIVLFTTTIKGQVPTVGTSIQGDFNGDEQKEYAFAVKTFQGQGNPLDGGTADEFSVNFSSDKLKSFTVGCCSIKLINEGDLNGNGKDEITVYQAPMNGNTYSMTTYSNKNGKWEVIINTFLIPTGGNMLSDEELQKRIFKENGSVYFYDVDLSSKNFNLVKKKVTLK